jgi:4-aminobutyrate aminotransferase-like enzyme/Ser/Thr protein kinase RdoA (MazF antagonist)
MPSHPQAYQATDVAAIALQHYGLEAKAAPTHGEQDATFRLTVKGKHHCLKITAEEPALSAALMQHLAKADLPMATPVLQPTQEGGPYTLLPDGHYAYLTDWLPGTLYAEVGPKGCQLWQSLGQGLGRLSSALQGFEHKKAQRELRWDNSRLPWIAAHLDVFEGEQRALADHFYALFQQEVVPRLPGLRQSVNYNDANDYNLLVQPAQVDDPADWHYRLSGLIDFGDAVYTHTINELAVALAYAMMGQPDPAGAAVEAIKAYHAEFPLQEEEVAALPGLIAARLLISVTVSTLNQQQAPERAYLQVSHGPAWQLLRQLKAIPPQLLHYQFRHACGWEPCPQATRFHQWMAEERPDFALVSPFAEEWRIMDLGVGSLELGNNQNFEDSHRFERHINRLMEDAGVDFGLGGYGEVRPFYTTDAYQVEGNEGPRWRSVHLGLDIWAEARTPVFAPLDGKVHSFADNAQDRDYGPAIILEHEPEEGLVFYTLYGHLSRESLEHLSVGMPVKKGQFIATFGEREVNGGWPPHLHFQVLLDTLGKEGDFPGVAFPEEWPVWSSLCPNPELLLHLPAGSTRPIRSEWSKAEILEKRQKHIGPNLSVTYQAPLHIVRAYRHYLYEADGRRYLDTVNNVPQVGHQNPKVVEAVQQQAAVLNTNTRYLHTRLAQYAEELLSTLPDELAVVYFLTSGSEANELALRMARTATGRQGILAMDGAYHGHTAACIDISAYKFNGKGGAGQPGDTHLLPLFQQDGQDAQRAVQQIQALQSQGKAPAAFISESILSCGGQLVPPAGYFKSVFEAVRQAGGLCIMDEVQTGFGRVGEAFWAFELQEVVPDMVVMGKPMGNGFPIGAVACTRAVADAFHTGMEFFSTFGGNPVAVAAGQSVLQVVQEEGLQQHVLETGHHLKKQLKQLQQAYPHLIADVRGHGLFLGVELSRDGQPLTKEARYLINRMRRLGILMSTDGPANNVLKIKPPMSFGRVEAERLVGRLSGVLREISEFM